MAVERSARELDFLRRNRRSLEAFNLRIVAGTAPEALASEPSPAAVFVGGTGGRLGAVLDLVADRLSSGGVVVANFVGLENLAEALDRLRALGWGPNVTQLQVARGEPLGGLTTFVPQRPVWIVDARRPSGPIGP